MTVRAYGYVSVTVVFGQADVRDSVFGVRGQMSRRGGNVLYSTHLPASGRRGAGVGKTIARVRPGCARPRSLLVLLIRRRGWGGGGGGTALYWTRDCGRNCRPTGNVLRVRNGA